MRIGEPNWEELIKEQVASGERIQDFCSRRGVNKYTFKKRKYGAASKAIEVGRFKEISRAEANYKIVLSNGLEVEVSGGFNASEVERLVRVLKSC